MQKFSFLHAADLHLDSPLKGMGLSHPGLKNKLVDASFRSLDRLVEQAVIHHVEFVLLAGDLFDLPDRSIRAQTRFYQAVLRLQEYGIRVYVVHGNHDPADGSWIALDWPDNIHFFSSSAVENQVAVNRDGEPIAEIWGISYATRKVTDNLLKQFPVPIRQDVYQIGLLHANVDGREGHESYSPCSLNELVQSGHDYWALGHIHQAQILHRDPYVVYSGCLQGRHRKEQGEKGCYLVQVEENKETTLQFMSLDEVRFIELSVDIEDHANLYELQQRIETSLERIVQWHSCLWMIRIRFVGKGSLSAALLNKEEIEDWLKDVLSSMEEWIDGSELVLESWVDETEPELYEEELEERDDFIGQVWHHGSDMDDNEKLLWMKNVLKPISTHRKASRHMPSWSTQEQQELLVRARNLAVRLLLEKEGG